LNFAFATLPVVNLNQIAATQAVTGVVVGLYFFVSVWVLQIFFDEGFKALIVRCCRTWFALY